jgi:Mn-dependent DtxR family transcriptional regulator
MSNDKSVLCAMLRLSRRREAADEDALTVRSGASPAVVRDSLRRLEAQGLIERRAERPPRLTLEGLAVAVAIVRMARTPHAAPLSAARTARLARRAARAA